MKKENMILILSLVLVMNGFVDTVSVLASIEHTTSVNKINSQEPVKKLNIEAIFDEVSKNEQKFLETLQINKLNESYYELIVPKSKQYEIQLDNKLEFYSSRSTDNSSFTLLFQLEQERTFSFRLIDKHSNDVYEVSNQIKLDDTALIESFDVTSIIKEIAVEDIEEAVEETEEAVEETEEAVEETEEAVEETEEAVEEAEEAVEETEEAVEETEEAVEETEATVEDAEEVVEETEATEKSIIEKNVPLLKTVMRVAALPATVDGFYTVTAGDSFNKIATKFNLSVLQLQVYNPQVKNINAINVGDRLAVTRTAVESRLSPEEKKRLYTGSGSSIFNGPADFFKYLHPYARELANLPNEERLYVSVILAQAALESGYGKSALASPPYYNLTGIKRKGTEKYVKMWTREETSTGESYYVLADFKVFDSYYDSIKGYAELIRYRGYYDSVWVKNAPTWTEAVKALGRSPYATDKDYGNKIMNMINTYNLYQYDYDTVVSSKKTSYYAKVKVDNSGIYTLPKYVSDAKLYTSYLHNSQDIQVVEEATTESGVFSKVSTINNGKILGWIKKSDLIIYDTVQRKNSVNYIGKVKNTNDGIYTLPKGTYKSLLYTSYLQNGKEFKVTEEVVTNKGTFSKLVSTSGNFIGWIDKSSLAIFNSKVADYYGRVKVGNSGIYTTPVGLTQSKLYTNYLYNWKSVKIIEEMDTPTGTYSKISDGFGKVLGWIKKNDLTIYSTTSTNYYAQVRPNNAGIYTAPGDLVGRKLYTSYIYNWKDVKINQEVVMNGETYANLTLESTGAKIGWIKKTDLSRYNLIQSERVVSNVATVKPQNSGIYTLPKGSYRAKLVTSYLYNWKKINVISEASTPNGIFVKISDRATGKIIGWISKADLSY